MGTKHRRVEVVIYVFLLFFLWVSLGEQKEVFYPERVERTVFQGETSHNPYDAGVMPPERGPSGVTGQEIQNQAGETGPGRHVEDADYVEQELLVQFAPSMTKDEIVNLLDTLGMSIEQILNRKNLCRVRLPESLGVEEALKIFHNVPDILFSEPNYIVHTTAMPNDPEFDNQWGLHNTGESGGLKDADIDAPQGWNIATGHGSIMVAVVDEGIDIEHDDLSANIWTNPGEIAGNGVDDDQNGYIDDLHGWDFYHDDETVFDSASEDDHGTAVAGIIGARGNNGKGIAGVSWRVQMMPVKFISNGTGTVADAVLALNYAAENGARVINCSWGGTSYSSALFSALQQVRNAGILVVASAGNSGVDTDTSAHYPSNYELPHIISVAATNRTDELSYFSNHGLTTVDLGAPGSYIYTTSPGGNYSYFSGTSAAAPFVSGAAALALSAAPGLAYPELKELILSSTDPIQGLSGQTVTSGRLNALSMLATLGEGDSDEDGMPNVFEYQYGLDPSDPGDADEDRDGDGLSNLQEYEIGTSPTDADSDGDGMPDGYEHSFLLDPTSDADAEGDRDEDGLSNLQEYQIGTRSDLADSDGDWIDDFLEFGPRLDPADSDGDGTLDALDTDSDNDGIPDRTEGTGDTDGDGAANWVDMNDSDGPEGDQDRDGLANALEVSFMLYPNLRDSDGDGIGDLTEFGFGQTPRDSDGDGESDALDSDSDNDGETDRDEGLGDRDGDDIPNYRDQDDNDGVLGDSDGDGLQNQLEESYGMNANLADSDNDGIDDSTEFGPGAEPSDTDGDGIIDPLDLDSDEDGVPDASEGDIDTDNDGVPDRLDKDTATMLTGYGKLTLILERERGTLGKVLFLAQAISEAPDPNLDFRYGGVQFEIADLEPGESVRVTIKMSSPFPSNAEFWKYSEAEGYYKYPSTVQGKTLEFTLTDGARGDNDGLSNGVIVDPGYIVIPEESGGTGSSARKSSPAGGGGGGGGGSGCALAPSNRNFQNGVLDLVFLMLPMGLLSMLKRSRPRLNPRGRPEDSVV